MRIFFYLILAIVLFVGLQQLIELKTHGFSLERIYDKDLGFHPEWETTPPDNEEEIAQRLAQPYTFLGAGSECFVFLSQDGKSVIKFFKLDTLRPVYLFRGLIAEDYSAYAPESASSLRKRVAGMRAFRIQRTLNSCKCAYDHLKEETGLIYMHLNPTPIVQKTLTLYDACGIAHSVDLQAARFYLQERATVWEKHLLTLKKNKEEERAKKCVDSLCDLIYRRCQKGFADRDPLCKNFGFIGDRAVEIDIGSFTVCSAMKERRLYQRDLFFITLLFKQWAKEHYPELVPHISQNVMDYAQAT